MSTLIRGNAYAYESLFYLSLYVPQFIYSRRCVDLLSPACSSVVFTNKWWLALVVALGSVVGYGKGRTECHLNEPTRCVRLIYSGLRFLLILGLPMLFPLSNVELVAAGYAFFSGLVTGHGYALVGGVIGILILSSFASSVMPNGPIVPLLFADKLTQDYRGRYNLHSDELCISLICLAICVMGIIIEDYLSISSMETLLWQLGTNPLLCSVFVCLAVSSEQVRSCHVKFSRDSLRLSNLVSFLALVTCVFGGLIVKYLASG